MTLWPLATAAALLLAGAWVAHRVLREWMLEQRAARLRAQAKPTIDRRLEHLDGLVDLPQLAAILALDLTTRGTGAAVLGPGGTVLAASPSEADAPAVPAVAPERLRRALDGDPHVTWTATGADGERLLVALVPPLAWKPEPRAVVALATAISDDERVLARLGLVLATGVLATGWLAIVLELTAGGAIDLLALLAVPVVLLAARRAARPDAAVEVDGAAAHPAVAPGETDFTEAMRRVEAAFFAQRASEDRMRRFVADASHEMRTPLTSLSGAAEVLLRGAKDDPAHAERVARVIQTQADRMRRLVEDLLTLARLDAGTALLHQPVALDALVAEHAEELELSAPGRTVKLETDPIVVAGDPERLRQVLTNLTANAVRHTRRNGTIALGVEEHDEEAVLTVVDDGDGIAEEELPRVFERFFRGDAARASEGSGLGLAIVREIVEAHGGHIEATSTPGAGACFAVRLPRAASADDQPADSLPTAELDTIEDMPTNTHTH